MESNKNNVDFSYLYLLKINDHKGDKSVYHFDDALYSRNPDTWNPIVIQHFVDVLENSGFEIFHISKNQIMTDSGLFIVSYDEDVQDRKTEKFLKDKKKEEGNI